MWWGGKLSGISDIVDTQSAFGGSCTYEVPDLALENIAKNVELLAAMDLKGPAPRVDADRFSFALPLNSHVESPKLLPEDPFDAFDSVTVTVGKSAEEYWSSDRSFWLKWKEDELRAKLSTTEIANTKLSKAKREAEQAAEQAKKLEQLRFEQEKLKVEAATYIKPTTLIQTKSAEKPVLVTDAATQFKTIMEEGKQFRSEFMPVWREISLAVSTTAGNSRSIQMNSTKLVTALSRAATQAGPSRPYVIRWLSGVCGSKIVSQAASGNKMLVWSFAYLARIVAEKFPDVARLGAVGELLSANTAIIENGSLPRSGEQPADYEMYTRLWVSMLCVFGDQANLWKWVTTAVNKLRNISGFIRSPEALWNMMLIHIFFDIGLYDFRRMFGTQAMVIVDMLEKSVFPRIDAQLQDCQQSTSSSVQLRFYLDACFNNLQSRKYTTPPEGQILAATRESDLNPEL